LPAFTVRLTSDGGLSSYLNAKAFAPLGLPARSRQEPETAALGLSGPA
jgi:hypothetical protein